MAEESHVCSLCGIEKPLTDFYRLAKAKNGRMCRCKACERLKQREYYKNNRTKILAQSAKWQKDNPERYSAWVKKQRLADPEKFRERSRRSYLNNRERVRDSRMKYKYGITMADYAAMSEAQGGVCAICSAPDKLVVDHNHDTGDVRGLLCHKCNSALGMMRESVRYCLGMIDYIKRYSGDD